MPYCRPTCARRHIFTPAAKPVRQLYRQMALRSSRLTLLTSGDVLGGKRQHMVWL